MKLITESVEDLRVTITEAAPGKERQFFIEGIFLQGEIRNRNGRVYPMNILGREVSRYLKEHVTKGIAYGELGHPEGPTINPERISHRIVSLEQDGSNYIGKAMVVDTPMGKIAKTLMESGGSLAVSSRGIGTVRSVGGVMQVQEDFTLATAADIVINPSAPDAFVNGIMEGVDWFWNNGVLKAQDAEQIKQDLEEAVRQKSLNENAIISAWGKFARLMSKP